MVGYDGDDVRNNACVGKHICMMFTHQDVVQQKKSGGLLQILSFVRDKPCVGRLFVACACIVILADVVLVLICA